MNDNYDDMGLPEYCIKQSLKDYEKQWSNAKYFMLIEQAVNIAGNAMYFPFRKRLVICKYILFGGKKSERK